MSDELLTVPKQRLEDLEAEVATLATAVRDLAGQVSGFVEGLEVVEEDPAAAAFARARAGFRARDRRREGT